MSAIDRLAKQQYICLETFRKNGEGVKTPVWFVQDGDTIFVHTGAESGKVKRIRRSSQINVAPCKMDGALLGEWIPAEAREARDPETEHRVDHLLGKKYGLMKKMFTATSALRGMKSTTIEIKLKE